MKRLTQKDERGNWCLKGVSWEQLHEGQVITKSLWERLYGALCKLMEYEDTGLTPEEIEQLKDKATISKMEIVQFKYLLIAPSTSDKRTHWSTSLSPS